MSNIQKNTEAIKIAAYKVIKNAKTIQQFRQALAVVLPLDTDMDAEQISRTIGVSKNWVSQLRGKFIRGQLVSRSEKGGRRNQIMTLQEEQTFMRSYLLHVHAGPKVNAKTLKLELEKILGRKVSQASVYNMINRNKT